MTRRPFLETDRSDPWRTYQKSVRGFENARRRRGSSDEYTVAKSDLEPIRTGPGHGFEPNGGGRP